MGTVIFMVPSTSSMGFLRRLLSFFVSFSLTRADSLSLPAVKDDESLARFVFDKKHISKTNGTVKPDAFLPHGEPAATSVFRTRRLDEAGIWHIGNDVAAKRERQLKGRADFKARTLCSTPLQVKADDVPPRHANIVNWPLEKSARLQFALVIAAAATLFKPPRDD